MDRKNLLFTFIVGCNCLLHRLKLRYYENVLDTSLLVPQYPRKHSQQTQKFSLLVSLSCRQ